MQDQSSLCCSAVSSHHRRTQSSVTQLVRISNLVEQFTVKEEEICETQRELFYLTLRLLMSYIYGVPILDVSRSHTTTQHSR